MTYETTELQRGRIVSVGDGYWDGGLKVKLKCGEGEEIFYTGGRPFKFAGEDYVGLSKDEVFCSITVEGVEHESRSSS